VSLTPATAGSPSGTRSRKIVYNVLMIGSPGTGKSMLAKRLPTILPPLTPAESLETTRIYSAMGRLGADEPLMTQRPFRSPHHTISDAGMVGGGSTPAPGEISMAHHGVLFLDELPEFNRKSLEVLRQPLEAGCVTISRALASTTFPARFVLVAAMNPCPCGYLGDPRRPCKCSPVQVERYMGRVPAPCWTASTCRGRRTAAAEAPPRQAPEGPCR
jgi:magnesium chelatase family protein